jgi:hypothetical protein
VTEDPTLPTIGDVIGAAKERLIEMRSSTVEHVEQGEYATVINGWRAQFAVERAYVAEEIKAARLPFSKGQALTELARSEYETPRNDAPTKAIGEVVLTRRVVHAAAGATITTATATDETTVVALLQAIASWLSAHILSVYSSSTGLEAHYQADATTAPTITTTNMGTLVGGANSLKDSLNWHFGNEHVDAGGSFQVHKDADTTSTVTASDAFASASGSAYSANSTASQQSLLLLANAMKAAATAHAALESRPGTVRAGNTVKVDPAPTAVPPVPGAQYTVLLDTYAARGRGSANVSGDELTVPIEATVTGAGANLPLWSAGGPTLRVTAGSPLFDASATLPFVITEIRAAGGSDGQKDEELRVAATAAWTGAWGPTVGALVAGTLRSAGVSHMQILEDTTRSGSVAYVADPSWGWSDRWSSGIERYLRDSWLGLGCKLSSGRVVNRVVRVEASVALRDAGLLVDPSAITAELQAVCKAYFDARRDWYIWRLSMLRGALSQASRKILSCTQVAVLDQDGLPIAEPSHPAAGDDITHWYFADNALSVSYTGPS